MKQGNFFAELKRRNVYKIAVAYLVVSWLLIQAASILLPTFDAPSWTMKVLVVILTLIFPVALILSWAFEVTPEGIKLESEIPANDFRKRETGRKIVGITIALAVTAAALFAFQFLRPRLTNVGVTTTPASAIPAKSIAVLPFENLSTDKENAFFASGIQDLILTKLAGIKDLKVISRTSTEKYASHPENLKNIAQELGVAKVLEGSVQKSGNSVLINVQMIDAGTDAHLWAEAYTRTLENIFGVEGEVAGKIAEALHAALSGNERQELARKPTENAAALKAYLKGLSLVSSYTSSTEPAICSVP